MENVRLLCIDGVPFAVDEGCIRKLGSEFLARLTNRESPFAPPEDGVYKVQADPECFSAICHLARFGALPSTMLVGSKKKTLEEASAFWGVEALVDQAIRQNRAERRQSLAAVLEAGLASISFEQIAAQILHHNCRRSDGNGRIYCTTCGNRDFDNRFRERDNYAYCKQCSKQIVYSENLDWCHQCSCCRSCQQASCPDDCHVGCNVYGYHRTPRPKPSNAVTSAVLSAFDRLR